MDQAFLVVILLLLSTFSTICFFNPILILKGLSFWPIFVKKMFKSINLSPRSEEALNMLIKDEELYIKQFGFQLQILRLTGIIGLFIALISFCRIFG